MTDPARAPVTAPVCVALLGTASVPVQPLNMAILALEASIILIIFLLILSSYYNLVQV